MPKDFDYSTLEGRVAAHCEWFEMEPPKLEYDGDGPDEVLITDELMDWISKSGGSYDWLLVGDPRGMALAFEEKYRSVREFEALLYELDKDARTFVIGVVRELLDGKITHDEAVARVDAYKGNKSAA